MILRIGPLTLPDGAPGDSLFFLNPADPDRPPVVVPGLPEAIRALHVDARTATCEPGLAAEAGALGLTVTELTETARAELALMALDLAGSDFAAIEDDGLVPPFCAALAGFVARQTRVGPGAPRILDVALEDGRRLVALVVGGPGLVLAPSAELAQVEGTAVLCSGAAPEILDALTRSVGLDLCPSCFRLAGGEKHRITDADLALLTAALDAVARLSPDPGATQAARVRGPGQSVALTLRNP
ncbi:MAG: hypothetical protein JNK88_04390 [Mangrovicoccus sp.]|nr:hypothetical protein [Mangrovicoccus sp.]